jgi:hypothetical protein
MQKNLDCSENGGGMLLWDQIISTRLYGFIEKKIVFFIASVAITSNLTFLALVDPCMVL